MKRTLIAAAVLAAASSSVFAHSIKNPYIFNATLVGEEVGIEGFVTLFGCVQVSGTAGAVVNNTQNVMTNATLNPNAQTYTSGHITTTINNSYDSIKGSGTAFATVTNSNSSSSSFSDGSHKTSSYSYDDQSSTLTGGGNQYSQKSAQIQGSFSHDSQNQGGHVSAGGQIGGSYSYSVDNGPNQGQGSFHAQGGYSAGYRASSYSNSRSVSGGFTAASSSEQGSQWTFSADQGSGHQASAMDEGGYSNQSSTETHSVAAAWGIDATLDKTDVDVTGRVTEHINTQKAGNLTATTGTGVGNGVSGNVGINVAEGVDNAQSNEASLASVDVGNVFGNAQVFNSQSSGGSAKIHNFMVNASVGDNSLQGASGNIGVNVASGIGNAQNNSLAASTTTVAANHSSDVAMVATDQNCQTASLGFNGSFEGTAMLGNNVLAYSSGNIGVNIAGGAGNLQHNGLAIAALSVSK
ncbi:hypothetical protein [Paraburkholderia lacunae]|uniref:Cell wall anchor protein n=1 Tax=Paraburkholderia lacunae TaxID=2211104 RepID=A0A370N6N2_9BURK|nr:hypothetical protein [Paraburkholderia lacunae]RDK01205.1 hypothetical protein DLM46_17935 [Paraburkholderia lacunae]